MKHLLKHRAIGSIRPTAPRPGPCSPSRVSPERISTAHWPSSGGSEGIQIRSRVGMNYDGLFGSRREGWRPDLPDACAEPFVRLLWLQLLELLGRVPKVSTAKFLEDGTLPD
jgi:hypothetical protein